jgi:hypothetical protein
MQGSLDNYYLGHEEPFQGCMLYLRKFLLAYSPQMSEHFKYGGAFFYYKRKPFCYFNVSRKSGQLYIGFVQGREVNHKLLLSEGRAQIKVFYVETGKDINITALSQILKMITGIRIYHDDDRPQTGKKVV